VLEQQEVASPRGGAGKRFLKAGLAQSATGRSGFAHATPGGSCMYVSKKTAGSRRSQRLNVGHPTRGKAASGNGRKKARKKGEANYVGGEAEI